MKLKKYLPFILFGLGLVVLAGVLFWVFMRPKAEGVSEDENVAEIPFEQRPFVTLTPTSDGHYLNMVVDRIVIEADTLDYELLYDLPDGRTQGVPGTVKLEGNKVERELLLGSESSGKFRYDEGVEYGTVTFRFRDSKGKLVGKISTDFHLLTEVDQLSDKGGEFSYTLEETDDEYFVVMNTLGLPSDFAGSVEKGPYGVLASAEGDYPGTVNLEGAHHYLDGKWTQLTDKKSPNVGVFIVSSTPE
jgi:hypothetical protein